MSSFETPGRDLWKNQFIHSGAQGLDLPGDVAIGDVDLVDAREPVEGVALASGLLRDEPEIVQDRLAALAGGGTLLERRLELLFRQIRQPFLLEAGAELQQRVDPRLRVLDRLLEGAE